MIWIHLLCEYLIYCDHVTRKAITWSVGHELETYGSAVIFKFESTAQFKIWRSNDSSNE